MTAEVAVMNKSAVALAADSKVTVGGGQKTYDTVNKIFTLSKIHPVGVMIFGNADFMEYPWETIIKAYRSERGKQDKRTINLWAADFLSFLRNFGQINSDLIARNIKSILDSWFSEIEDETYYEAHRQGVAIGSPDFEKIMITEVEARVAALSRARRIISRARMRDILKRFSTPVAESVSSFISSRNTKLINAALDFASLALFTDRFSPQASGVVIAGFGRQEVFPATAAYMTDGYVGRSMKLSARDSTNVSHTNQSSIQAFAQNEIVHRFMEGIDPGYADFLRGMFRTALVESNIKTFEKWAPKSKQNARTRNNIAKAADQQYQTILQSGIRYRRDQFSMPTLDMVSLLPKDQLGYLAESLVELTSLHHRVSRSLETVGGPIDVAVISKGDGFIWIRRKHYFNLEMNRHFELNYMRGT